MPSTSNPSPPPDDAAAPPLADFRFIADLVRDHARERPRQPALIQGPIALSWGELDALMDRIAAGLHRDGVLPGAAVALAGSPTPLHAALFLGALRAGAVVAPLPHSVSAADFASMLGDAQAQLLFVDDAA
ncbi:MAG TPA: class I adenylate-forming enzyme family protein, partial [Albitalea sp.]